ncbi:efflux RND transporter permease subunit [Catenovulum sp. SM1970]|uniref:efflux RND transporter permease subunit n=1 Tax=Marinifaba aquimaris TaxID=2741323 RepID=UPI001572C392|nr:efflux RND transporter permease subunit [Marinifaba aquimaris]NTS77420.1 efflux RND transporter permease subunit [Marinifaba aquimaris]
MLGMINAAISRGRTVLMIFMLLLVAGSITYSQIPKEADPDITIPFIYVSIPYPGISPEDAERMLVRPMEKELRSIEGIKEMKATASEGHASVTMEFVAGFNVDTALADVRAKVAVAKGYLPSDTEEPTVHQVTLANETPVITVILSGPISERGILMVARELKDKLETLGEVLEVDIGGDRRDILEIIVDPLKLESYGLDQSAIFDLVSKNNRLIAAGTMDAGAGRFAIKVPSVFETVQDIWELPVKVNGDKIVTFKDVAEVRRSYMDPSTFARLNGERSISLEVKKRPGENAIETVQKVKAIVNGASQLAIWPNAMNITYTGDQSKDVKEMLFDLQNNVLSAVILVVIVVVAILGARTAALVGIAIPGSFLTGILVLAIFGLTINIVVLFALIMAVGMLVDGAIVVTEYADRCMSEGMEKRQAYLEAAKRMAWPITASTATTLAAFAPLLFWPGIMGEFMQYLPITLIATLAASLFMALVFVPTLGSIFGKARPLSAKARKQMLQAEQGDLTKLTGFTGKYVRALDKAIRHPVKVLFASIGIAIGVFIAYGASDLGAEFFPDVDGGGINISVRSYGDYSVYEKDKVMRQIESRLMDMDEIETIYTLTGADGDIGQMRLNPVDWQQRRKLDDIVAEVRERTADIYGIDLEVRRDENGPGGSDKDLKIQLSSRFPDKVVEAAHILKKTLANDAKFTNVEDDASKPGIEWQLIVDRADAARFGADASLVGNTVSMVTNGLQIGDYRPDDADREVDIRVRLPVENRHLGQLDSLNVQTPYGLVPISYFVERKAAQKVESIHKVDSKKVITVMADMAPGALLNQELPRMQEVFPSLGIDPSVQIEVKGQNEEEAESSAFLINAFAVALFVMAIILVTQFNSFYQAFLILSAVLFSTVGVFLGLLIAQKPFGIVMSGIGVISLAGIVVNNNIVLIDTFNQMRKKGIEIREAILRTGAQRLRPVLMTTVTTILGLMPMVLEMNVDLMNRLVSFGAPSTQWWSQLATAVAGGLAFATLLTLVLTPCMLMMGVNTRAFFERRKDKKQQALRDESGELKTVA